MKAFKDISNIRKIDWVSMKKEEKERERQEKRVFLCSTKVDSINWIKSN